MTNTDMAQAGQQAEQAAHQESLPRRIQQVIDRLPGKFITRLELAAVLSAVFFVVQSISNSSSTTHNSNEQWRLVRPVAAQSQTPATTDGEQAAETFDLTTAVKDYMKRKIEFPDNLSKEEYKAFIDKMNEIRGPQPIWTDSAADAAGNRVIYYHDAESNSMKTVSGSYESNKDLLEKNSYPLYVEVYTEEKTGNLQFVHPMSKELITVPDSANFNWSTVITADNYYQSLADGTLNLSGAVQDNIEFLVVGYDKTKTKESEKLERNIIPAVLMDQQPIEFVKYQGRYFPYNCLKMLSVKTKNGQPIYGTMTLVGSQGCY
ncbi:MAG: hypothetical protein AB9907_07735 [Flexilinea sp.]